MRTRPALGLLVLLTLTIAAPQFVVAGTINVSGSLTFTGLSSGSVSLVGDRGFTVNAFTDAIDASVGPSSCFPCLPGQPISVHVFDNAFRGTATLDGITYPSLNGIQASDALLLMMFDGTPLIAPPVNVASTVALTNPVDFTGTFFLPFGAGAETLAASAEATAVLKRINCGPSFGDCWQFESATYNLEATPEPTTLLLWGTMIAGLGLARWKRRRQG